MSRAPPVLSLQCSLLLTYSFHEPGVVTLLQGAPSPLNPEAYAGASPSSLNPKACSSISIIAQPQSKLEHLHFLSTPKHARASPSSLSPETCSSISIISQPQNMLKHLHHLSTPKHALFFLLFLLLLLPSPSDLPWHPQHTGP